jgi:hypothetical protein
VPLWLNSIPHVPLTQTAVWQLPPPEMAHGRPHPPQFWTLVAVLVQLSALVAPVLQQTSPEEQGRVGLFVPCAMGLQVPAEPLTLHASHVSPQAVLQHTPSAQKPLVHSPGPTHAAPLIFVGLQTLSCWSQNSPVPHCALIVHGVQTPALQKPLGQSLPC